ncbi:MAG TPA: hypothetical protein VGQ08_15760 [Nitrospiraceae bacterium]|jgi:hypothetical protein|nr:hypothetical protein [Nitrospiraceae bacterium]
MSDIQQDQRLASSDQKLKRKKGRPSAKQKDEAAPAGYPFPSLDDILRMSEQQVQVSFDEIGAEPSPFRWSEDDPQINVSHWHDYGMTLSDADRLKSIPTMKDLKASAKAIHLQCLRTQLLQEHLKQWISSLSDTALIGEVEKMSGEKLSESAKRYSKRSDLMEQLEGFVWPVLIKASTLYVQPESPLATGGK